MPNDLDVLEKRVERLLKLLKEKDGRGTFSYMAVLQDNLDSVAEFSDRFLANEDIIATMIFKPPKTVFVSHSHMHDKIVGDFLSNEGKMHLKLCIVRRVSDG